MNTPLMTVTLIFPGESTNGPWAEQVGAEKNFRLFMYVAVVPLEVLEASEFLTALVGRTLVTVEVGDLLE